jgi:hypothetical protein
MMTKSIPMTSVSYHPVKGWNASTNLYLCRAFGNPLLDVAQHRNAVGQQKRNGSARGTRNDGTVNWPIGGRPPHTLALELLRT